jgi:hypothetical protein
MATLQYLDFNATQQQTRAAPNTTFMHTAAAAQPSAQRVQIINAYTADGQPVAIALHPNGTHTILGSSTSQATNVASQLLQQQQQQAPTTVTRYVQLPNGDVQAVQVLAQPGAGVRQQQQTVQVLQQQQQAVQQTQPGVYRLVQQQAPGGVNAALLQQQQGGNRIQLIQQQAAPSIMHNNGSVQLVQLTNVPGGGQQFALRTVAPQATQLNGGVNQQHTMLTSVAGLQAAQQQQQQQQQLQSGQQQQLGGIQLGRSLIHVAPGVQVRAAACCMAFCPGLHNHAA